MEGIAIEWESDVLDFIVDQALHFNLGARGLRAICESIITDAMFELPSRTDLTTFTVSMDYVQEQFGKSTWQVLRSAA